MHRDSASSRFNPARRHLNPERRRPAWLLLLGLSLVACSAPPGIGPPPDTTHRAGNGIHVTETLANGLNTPWSLAVLPDGGVLVSERDTARIALISPGGSRVIGTVKGVEANGEGGLLGIAVSPAFEQDAWLYAYFTAAEDNRVVRMKYSPDGLGTPQVLLDGIAKAPIHNGGRIKFGPDGLLYIGTGDAGESSTAQDPSSLNGKILRIGPSGDSVAGNPRPPSPVYSMGHRNVQGLAWDAAGRLWASEFGPDVNDELNVIISGGNYGWPEVTGAPGASDYLDAKTVWRSTSEASPSGLAILNGNAYTGALRGQRLWQVPLSGTSTGTPMSSLENRYGRLRDVTSTEAGGLLVATNEGDQSRILRVALDERDQQGR